MKVVKLMVKTKFYELKRIPWEMFDLWFLDLKKSEIFIAFENEI